MATRAQRDTDAVEHQRMHQQQRGGAERRQGLQYFRNRVSQARRDVDPALRVTLTHCRTRARQQRALDILHFKLDILWAMSDAMAAHCGLDEVRR